MNMPITTRNITLRNNVAVSPSARPAPERDTRPLSAAVSLPLAQTRSNVQTDANAALMLTARAQPKPAEAAKTSVEVPVMKTVGTNSQGDPAHSEERYHFADKAYGSFGVSGTIGGQGCTITSLTNALTHVAKKTGLDAPTVSDTNNRSEKFFDVLDRARFTDLTGNKMEVKRNWLANLGAPDQVKIPNAEKRVPAATFTYAEKPIANGGKDEKGTVLPKGRDGTLVANMKTGKDEPQVLKNVRESLKNGQPVVLGMAKDKDPTTRVTIGLKNAEGQWLHQDRRNADHWGRHTVVAVGINKNNEILIRDPAWQPSKDPKNPKAEPELKTLKQTMEYWGDNNIDMAYAVTTKTAAEATQAKNERAAQAKQRQMNSLGSALGSGP